MTLEETVIAVREYHEKCSDKNLENYTSDGIEIDPHTLAWAEYWLTKMLNKEKQKDCEVGMKEITFPVLVLDDECRMCEELNIVSDTPTRMYGDDKCIAQHTLVRCSNVYKCMRIQERLKERQHSI